MGKGGGKSAARGGGGSGGQVNNTTPTRSAPSLEELSTDKGRKQFLRSLDDGDTITITRDESTVVIQKMDGVKKYEVSDSGIRYNRDGSYSPYKRILEVGETAAIGYFSGARRVQFGGRIFR